MVCTVLKLENNERFGCEITSDADTTEYYYYRLQTFEDLPANSEYEIMITSQNGNANEGITFPSATGKYKVEIQVDYSSSSSQQVSQAHFIEVYGPNFSVLNFLSTIDVPGQPNMILVDIVPSNTI